MEYAEWKEEIKEVPIEDCCEMLGIEYRRQGSLLSILCPNPAHNDQHYGSCFIKNGRYTCYACGDHGDNIKLVQNVKMMSYQEATHMIARYANIPSWDDISYQQDEKEPLPLTDKQLKLLGLSSRVTIQHINGLEDVRPENGSWIRDLEGYATYIPETVNLVDLYREDKDLFNEMVIGKLFYRLIDLLTYYLTETFSSVKEQEATEMEIEGLIPLAYRYQKVCKKYGYDLGFVKEYKKKTITRIQTRSLSKFKFAV
ncbi:hypothetical protein bpr_II362 (plasmid) [Butyrivibrio proteoclasticus B316]|uniref:Zinc finger CHC2-type domain-containing protein n=1 Tax=Butyrivibrio proteoclasticus (strain ATCC 51982 / DSM 14932 / B316) TaxID=515622 RepID=E0S4G7_BUTPB|nr:CHC2 zinc finger domain-containing protein [Butyrivibrio proteoclasticus]ADL36299.1 hypothetical protein bpr_II362 [Butyrivibrio proteoclasticus B316]